MSNQTYPSMASQEMIPKERVVTMSEVHRTPGKVFREVARDKKSLVVESNGLFIAKIVPYDEYSERKRAAQKMRKFLDSVSSSLYSEAEVEADVQKAVQEVRAKRRKKK